MSTRISSLVTAALILAVTLPSIACGSRPSMVPSGLPPIPVVTATEAQDEWLHHYCAPKKLVTAESLADADQQVRAVNGNFGEIVYEAGGLSIVAFACASPPTWVAGLSSP